MPTFQFEAMDATGQEIKDVIDAPSQDEAQATIRQMGYFVTKISVKKARKTPAEKKTKKKGKTFALGGVKSKILCTFTRQLAILQDAGLPILRSLKILQEQSKPGAMKNALIDVCDEIESGATLSEAIFARASAGMPSLVAMRISATARRSLAERWAYFVSVTSPDKIAASRSHAAVSTSGGSASKASE